DAVMYPAGQTYLLRHAQEQLRQSNERLRTVLRSISDAVIAVDATGRVEMLNAQAERLTGWKENEARGALSSEVFSVFDAATHAPQFATETALTLAPGVARRHEQSLLLTRDGVEVPVSASAATLTDERGDVAGSVLVFHDQSSERRSQQQLDE